jgi:serine/threonine-protein kinase PRP4
LYELYTGKILFPGKTNHHMLKLFMDLKGKFPHKMLRKARFASEHFDDHLEFVDREMNSITGKETVHRVSTQSIRDLRSMLIAHSPKNAPEMLDKCLALTPDKRLTVSEVLRHPFITGHL